MSAVLPPAAARPGLLFQWLRWRLLCNTLRVHLQRTPVRVISIFLCSTLIWGMLFTLSKLGFEFLSRELNVPLDMGILDSLLSLLFLVLTVLLTFSTGIILYSSLFASAETAFLLSTPAPADHVFAFHFQGAVAFSSWAFILLGSPILLAYGLVHPGTPWYFYLLVPVFFLGYVLLPGSLGALLCLLIVNFVPRQRKQVVIVAVLAVLTGLAWWGYQVIAATEVKSANSEWVDRMLGQLALFQGFLVPWHWMAKGLMAAAVGDQKMFYYLALIWSNGLFLYLMTALLAARLFRRGYNRVATGGTLRRRYGGAGLDRCLRALLGWLPLQTRLLIVKDFRTFRRDPAQWAQILIFVGLASLYFTNVGRFYEQKNLEQTIAQKGVISLLNLSATSFLLCAYTGRFIFPMLSLEGRKFWILGLLPLRRDRLLWGKFSFSAIGCFLLAEFVVVLSNLMLGMSWLTLGLHALIGLVLALGLSALSVGLGAAMPNFQETDPSKLAVGFGGTLNLVASLLFLLGVIGLMAVPWHVHIALLNRDQSPDPAWAPWISAGVAAGLLVGVAAVLLPLRFGIRALRSMEF